MDSGNLQIIVFNFDSNEAFSTSLEQLHQYLNDDRFVIWINCLTEQIEEIKQIQTILQLNDDAVQFFNSPPNRNMLEEDLDSLSLQLQCLRTISLGKSKTETFASLRLYLTKSFCLTVSTYPIIAINDLLKNHHKAVIHAKTSSFLIFLVFDNVLHNYANMLLKYEVKLDQMDLKIRETHKNIFHDVMKLKRELIRVRRYSIVIHDFLSRMSGRKMSVVSEDCRVSLSELYLHAGENVSECESIKDNLNSLLDQIDNTLMQRMNESMRVLTAFASIFLPLTLITGVYGMNFKYMPELNWQYGYFIVLGFIIFCGLGMLYLFKRVKWF